MYFVDFDSMDEASRPIDMTITLRSLDKRTAIEEAKRLKAFTGSSNGRVYSLTPDDEATHTEIVTLKGDEITRTRFEAADIGATKLLINLMQSEGVTLFPAKFIVATV